MLIYTYQQSGEAVSQVHRDEAMYISMIDFQWTSTETKSFQ